MRVLVDTNVLGRLAQSQHPLHRLAVNALDRLDDEGHELRVVRQVLYEFWVIATRPVDQNGFGYSVQDAMGRLQWFKLLFPPLRDERGKVKQTV